MTKKKNGHVFTILKLDQGVGYIAWVENCY